MFGNKKLKDEIVRLRHRVADLEERLCPRESHDWQLVDTEWVALTPNSNMEEINVYKCKTCGKLHRTIK